MSELAVQRRLAWRKMGKRTGVAFVRESFSVDDLKTILSASDRYDWRFHFSDFYCWAQSALHFEGYNVSGTCGDWLDQCLRRHVLYRYGLALARKVESSGYGYHRSCPTDSVGHDPTLVRELTRSSSAEIEPVVAFDDLPERREHVAVRDRTDKAAWRIVALLLERRRGGPSLVVAPASVRRRCSVSCRRNRNLA